ncbi:TetR/AcrR family transcriptional regulator [Peribacillus simplex]|uniref:TetR/AcrR family transcriptional regulator n=1 Tax=Peribacillus simplex TaxID=1478 RepID=UPI0025A22FF0|nr:TetR/AcrR family transcriptional regulator [Peribacillus simplex]MDM5291861.1 TetR/AcrR family transcriptional regulator [Peribacillus simplex]
MRNKDENKNQAIFNSTIELINEIGFANLSMSKIAKRANISTSTIYVYYENKEDLLVKLYLNVKEHLSKAMLNGLHKEMNPQEICRTFMWNALQFMTNNQQWFMFLQQYSSSPFMRTLCAEDTNDLFAPVEDFFEKGIASGDLKNVNTRLLMYYCYDPLVQLANEYYDQKVNSIEQEFELRFLISWDAIKK